MCVHACKINEQYVKHFQPTLKTFERDVRFQAKAFNMVKEIKVLCKRPITTKFTRTRHYSQTKIYVGNKLPFLRGIVGLLSARETMLSKKKTNVKANIANNC